MMGKMGSGLKTVFASMPKKFDEADYDFNSFRRVFLGGTMAIWILVIAIYVIYGHPHNFAALLVALCSALAVTLVLIPLSIAQANRGPRNKPK